MKTRLFLAHQYRSRQCGFARPWRIAPPLWSALLAQAAAALLLVLLLAVSPVAGFDPWSLLALQGALAAAASALLRAPRWWWWINAAFPLAIYGALQLEIAPLWYFAAFVLSLLVFWRTDQSRVPLYLSSRATAEALLALLPVEPVSIVDLGCGDASLLRHLARARPDCRFLGIEHAPLTAAWAKLASRKLTNLEVRRGDFWQEDLAPYAVVYAFLSPEPMPRLIEHAGKTMNQGTLLISNSFMAPGVEPESVIEVHDRRRTRLYCYRMRGRRATAWPLSGDFRAPSRREGRPRGR